MRLVAWIWLLFSVLVLALIANGSITTYVQTFWRPVLAVACVLVAGTAVDALLRARRGDYQRGEDDRTHAAHTGHGVELPPRYTALLLLLPAGLIVACAPSPLGAAMLSSTQRVIVDPPVSAQAGSYVKYPALAPHGINRIGLDQLSERLSNGDPAALRAKTVEFEGFVSADSSVTGVQARRGILAVNRFKISCCAADAIAYTALVRTPQTFPADTWLRVRGTVDLSQAEAGVVVVPTSIQRIPVPKVPYL